MITGPVISPEPESITGRSVMDFMFFIGFCARDESSGDVGVNPCNLSYILSASGRP
ncbi:MAG: hypothetical protein BWY05_01117 [Euryarchaeota archaeon ADurb.Bin165]|nr:MAG: hypothetical protein BWY05_01117 [Euryarchaeota archaeon ADurb.Bin165]